MSKDPNEGLSDRTTSCVTGAIGLVGSLTYIVAALRIEDSLLADAVGILIGSAVVAFPLRP